MLTPVTVLSFTTSAISDSVHSGLSEALLDEAEAPVRGKLGVACDQEVKVQILVELVHGDTRYNTRTQTCSCFGLCSYHNSGPHVFSQLRIW